MVNTYDSLELFRRENSELRLQIKILEKKVESLSKQARIDSLTGLLNRNGYRDSLERSIDHAERYHERVCVAFLDLDGLKRVNDTYGHESGDTLIVSVARQLTEGVRSTDYVCRIGGDEYVIIFPDARLEDALKRINEIQCLIEEKEITLPSGVTTRCGVSVGVAEYRRHEGLESFIARADALMYAEKRARKCVIA